MGGMERKREAKGERDIYAHKYMSTRCAGRGQRKFQEFADVCLYIYT